METIVFVLLLLFLPRRLRDRRAVLLTCIKDRAEVSLVSLESFCAGLYVPDGIRPEFERRRRLVLDQVEAMVDFVVTANDEMPPDRLRLLREHLALHKDAMVSQHFPSIMLSVFRRETGFQFSAWAIHVQVEAEGTYHYAMEHATNAPQDPTCQWAMTALVPAFEGLEAAVKRVTEPSEPLPDPADVRALDLLVRDMATWAEAACDVSRVADMPSAHDGSAPARRWMIQ